VATPRVVEVLDVVEDRHPRLSASVTVALAWLDEGGEWPPDILSVPTAA
jgi:hypothetical protein